MKRFITAEVLEKEVGFPQGSITPIHMLVIREQAAGRKIDKIATGLRVSEAELEEAIRAVTGDELLGSEHEMWVNAVMLVRSVGVMNQQSMAVGWDAIEAMAVNRLGEILNNQGAVMKLEDALAIATTANKAARRHTGEGSGSRVNVNVNQGGGLAPDMDVEINSGNLGSIRLSLSSRVRQQLEQPKTIEGEAKKEARSMLTLDQTRNLVPNG